MVYSNASSCFIEHVAVPVGTFGDRNGGGNSHFIFELCNSVKMDLVYLCISLSYKFLSNIT